MAEEKTLRDFVSGKVFVFIDAANLENSVKDLEWWVDYKKLYQFFNEQTKLVGIRHYGVRFNNHAHDKFLTVLKRAGIRLITKPLKIIKQEDVERGDIRKANFDVEIAVDSLTLIDKYDTLILFSGDSDFDSLIKLLKTKGKRVGVISTKHHISRELREGCDFYIDLKKLKNFLQRDKKAQKSPPFAVGG